MCIRRRRNRTRITRARNGGKQDALTHAITMGAGFGPEERHAEISGAAGSNGNGDASAVRPVFIRDGEIRLRQAGEEIRRDENLDAVFLRVDLILGVGAGDEDATVLHDDGFGVVEAGDDGVCHDGDAGADGLRGIVEEGVEVWGGGEAEAGLALMGAVEDEISAVGQGGHAGHDAGRGHALQGPFRGCGFGLGGDAVVEGDALVGG